MTRHCFDISTARIACRDADTLIRLCVRLVAALLCFSAICCGQRAAAQTQEVVDARKVYNVKAVTLYAFGRYVTWPDSAFAKPDSPFIIGLYSDNPFGDALDQIAAKKTIAGRPIVVRQCTSPDECAHCHILFVTGAVPPEKEAKLFQAVAGKSVLLVGESAGFAERGGIVNFYQNGTNVRFELNPDKASEAQLSFDAKLLSLGTKVPSRK
jgi:YfiR/HmsC-like